MKLYNTLTKKKETIEPLNNSTVSMYVCGPTVYNYPHLGNLRTNLNTDFLRRSLKYLGFEVNEVMNITDIEDKIIRDSAKQGIPYTELTAKYEKVFLDNLRKLNIEMPEHLPRATEEIPEMIKIIEKLLSDGYAYKSDDGSVYFDISKFKSYGKLSGLDKRELKACARIEKDEYEKENAQDFALWKAEKPGEPAWEAPFGKGRPGWHIECTAMSTKYLGDTIDIHAGGVDLIFPHHENEIAQSEAYTGKPFVRNWFHGEHLLVSGKKMAKRDNNFYILEDLAKKFEVSPLAFRLLVATSHYRDKLNLTEKSLKAAEATLNNLYSDILRIKAGEGEGKSRVSASVKKAQADFKKALGDDLAMPQALAAVFKLMNESGKATSRDYNKAEKEELGSFIAESDSVLGLGLDTVKVEIIPKDILEMAQKREEARETKDFYTSDKMRAKIEAAGYEVEDTKEGPIVRKL